MSQARRLCVLGATGSIGESTLALVRAHPDRFQIDTLTAHSNWQSLLTLCREFEPRVAVLSDASNVEQVQHVFRRVKLPTELHFGPEALSETAAEAQSDTVIAGIVGAAGLPSTLAAVRAGKRVLLANKEALVCAGELFMQEVSKHKATLLPLDSEHNALFQCLPDDAPTYSATRGIKKLVITASGGPFLRTPLSELAQVTPEQAVRHPKWSMGRKISVDSATMMNKGLELIEARWLFGVPPEKLDVLIHPQSTVHALVEYVDGSWRAQLGSPDMQTPIAHALAWPERIGAEVAPLDLAALRTLEFFAPDEKQFPCLTLARQAMTSGGAMPLVLNAANEVAVEAFLNRSLKFTDIATTVEHMLDTVRPPTPQSVDEVIACDAAVRRQTLAFLETRP